jgi:predicted PurR-regulated permease PerM
MSPARPIAFWITTFAAIIAAVVLLREILLPFVAGMMIAYLLNPVVTRMERWGLNRGVATLVIVAILMVGVGALIFFSVPVIVRELEYFIDHFPGYIRQLQALATDPSHPWVSKVVGEGLGTAEKSIGEITSLAASWSATFLRSAWSGGQALISVFSLAVVTPIVACYLVYDWPRMIAVVDNWVPPARRETIRTLAREIDDTIGGFVRGQSALCLILGIFYAAALWLMGLNHSPLIGFAAGVISFVPYLGSLTGLIISTCVAVAQFWPSWGLILMVPAIFFVGQSLADYVLSPYLVGRRVNLNPVWLMFALFAFGYLFGFFGLLIAVPLAAAIGVLTRFALAQYRSSSFYVPAVPASTEPPTVATEADPVRRTDII